MKLLKSFVDRIQSFPQAELETWIMTGLTAYHDPVSPAYRRAERAFEGASLCFGQGGPYAVAVDDLCQLYESLSDVTRLRFDCAVARVLALLSLKDRYRCDVLRDLIELALETKNSYAIEAVGEKLRLPDPAARRLVCLEAVYFLDEGHAVPDMLRLGRRLLEMGDFPLEISAHLLVGLCRLDPLNAVEYAMKVHSKLAKQLNILRQYPEQYAKFQDDFAAALSRTPENRPDVFERLLAKPLYAELLRDKLAAYGDTRASTDAALPVVIKLCNDDAQTAVWLISWKQINVSAAYQLLRQGGRPTVEQTLSVVMGALLVAEGEA